MKPGAVPSIESTTELGDIIETPPCNEETTPITTETDKNDLQLYIKDLEIKMYVYTEIFKKFLSLIYNHF